MSLGENRFSIADMPDEGIVIVPFAFAVNGTTTPLVASVKGDLISGAVTRNGAGSWTLSLAAGNLPKDCLFGVAVCSTTANGVDFVCKIDWSQVVAAGTFTVRTMTGAVETDPADTTLIGGQLFCKKTDRKASR